MTHSTLSQAGGLSARKKNRLRFVLFAAALALLPAHASHAAISMEIGDQGIQIDENGASFETGDRNFPRDDGGETMRTSPRPNRNGTQQLPELPYGIVPEVYIPWYPPDQRRPPHYPGGNAGHSGRPAYNDLPLYDGKANAF